MSWNENDNLDLAQFDDEFESAAVEEKEFDEIPDGKYQVKVDRVELTRSESSGNPMLKWALKILGPTCKGRLLWRNNVIASKDNVKWLKNDLYICGLQIEKLSELSGKLESLLDVGLEVTKRTKNEFENIYFNRRIVLDDSDASGSAGGSNDNDMIPF
jgi:hypothetical protein